MLRITTAFLLSGWTSICLSQQPPSAQSQLAMKVYLWHYMYLEAILPKMCQDMQSAAHPDRKPNAAEASYIALCGGWAASQSVVNDRLQLIDAGVINSSNWSIRIHPNVLNQETEERFRAMSGLPK